ncbi:hypothetical protein PHYBOEH_002432 [Phytophthora boehmeriae]|uniref:O-phosphoseryl-tRNA(Sec) selenium transferase n=1 Tax=Phytophthora boehmeriae TaxID=109152 RepID=A0A8T1XAB7_9STRA|nr:hypothetical protein PHYBOEH_002432 [Phytophthora boehmeriae]
MNAKSAELAAQLVPATYIQQGLDAVRSREKLVTTLLAQRRLPDNGWDDASVELLLQTLSAMDSNNFRGSAGAGEREARVFSPIVARRHFYLAHGVGRSGDVAAVQPKAAGSSLMVQLANAMAKDVLRLAGLRAVESALVLPVATGMSLTLVLLQLKEAKPDARYVIWPRIDQKSCFKSIVAAGLTPLVLENVLMEEDGKVGGQLKTDLVGMAGLLDRHGSASVLAVMSTTSCFAPRAYDSVEEIAKLCKEYDVAHVINNAYGVQASKCVHQVEVSMRTGRVDAVVQSLDKNFMVPIGGAIVCSPSRDVIDRVAKFYPGRASATPTLDFFITMLQMGRNGYRRLLENRKHVADYMREQLQALAGDLGERLLHVSSNEISFAMTLATFYQDAADTKEKSRQLTLLGAMLFSRGVSGAR